MECKAFLTHITKLIDYKLLEGTQDGGKRGKGLMDDHPTLCGT